VREAREETGLEVRLEALLGCYSDPARDPRGHTVSVVYVGWATGQPVGGDDAAHAEAFSLDDLPEDLAFDHREVLDDYRAYRRDGRPAPLRG
jgi:8-oxo-dGTP diphosphatase